MKFTPEHHALRRTVRGFVDREINPFVDEWEAKEIFPAKELFKKMGSQGLLGISRPAEWGGGGLDFSYTVVAAEELGRIDCGGVPMAIGVQGDMATPALARFGSDELRAEFLAPSLQGDLVACLGVSEPEAGSDVAGIKTFARKDGDDYVITGSKMWITNGMQADWMCMLANTSTDTSIHKNKSLIVVPLDLAGVTRAKKLKKIGMWSSDTAQLFFDEVRVPRRYLIGPEEGMGFFMQMLQFQEERLWGAANGVGGMEPTIRDTIEYTRTRKTFGRPILDNQVVHFRFAELLTELEALRALVYAATEQMIDGDDVTRLASMAKLKTGRLIREVTDSCLQYWGGMGYMWETKVARAFRDGRLVSIGGGADEIMLGIICKLEGILPRRGKE
jgi:citronellyl-CoA dehydrogenase